MTAVVAAHESTAKAKAMEWGAEVWTTDYEKLLKMENIDAIDVCVSHHLHAEMAVAAAEAGKHILLEKPIAITLEQADRIISALKKLASSS